MIKENKDCLFLIGSSHQVADLSARERISLPSDLVDPFTKDLESCPDWRSTSS